MSHSISESRQLSLYLADLAVRPHPSNGGCFLEITFLVKANERIGI